MFSGWSGTNYFSTTALIGIYLLSSSFIKTSVFFGINSTFISFLLLIVYYTLLFFHQVFNNRQQLKIVKIPITEQHVHVYKLVTYVKSALIRNKSSLVLSKDFSMPSLHFLHVLKIWFQAVLRDNLLILWI